ncbi:D(1)-like dopamine receptor [Folsomia candida]|uniref:D(1)-like dopamine receptor n=1 Tax=Folsomia candida TaxID=158441 RepID=A0A226E7K6_FOLCA|nr:D(1)-like dopamine receptor [Folsomia candida]
MVSLNNHLFDMANITSRFYEEGYAAAGDSDHHHPNAPNFLNNLNLSWETENKYYNVNLDEFSTEMGSPSDPFPTPGDTTASLGWGDLALVSLFCSIIAGTVAGNTLVIAAVITTRRLRTVTNCFVMSLAVADWLVGVFVMPPKVALYLVHQPVFPSCLPEFRSEEREKRDGFWGSDEQSSSSTTIIITSSEKDDEEELLLLLVCLHANVANTFSAVYACL